MKRAWVALVLLAGCAAYDDAPQRVEDPAPAAPAPPPHVPVPQPDHPWSSITWSVDVAGHGAWIKGAFIDQETNDFPKIWAVPIGGTVTWDASSSFQPGVIKKYAALDIEWWIEGVDPVPGQQWAHTFAKPGTHHVHALARHPISLQEVHQQWTVWAYAMDAAPRPGLTWTGNMAGGDPLMWSWPTDEWPFEIDTLRPWLHINATFNATNINVNTSPQVCMAPEAPSLWSRSACVHLSLAGPGEASMLVEDLGLLREKGPWHLRVIGGGMSANLQYHVRLTFGHEVAPPPPPLPGGGAAAPVSPPATPAAAATGEAPRGTAPVPPSPATEIQGLATPDFDWRLPTLPLAALAAAWLTRLRWLAPAVGLFTRIHRAQALEHPRRAALMDAIQDAPGATHSDLRRTLGVGPSPLVHHLGILEKTGLVRRVHRKGRTHYFPSHVRTPVDLAVGTQRRVLLAVRAMEGATQRKIARALGIGRQSVAYHARALQAAGLVRTERSGRVVRHFSAPGGRPGLPDRGSKGRPAVQSH